MCRCADVVPTLCDGHGLVECMHLISSGCFNLVLVSRGYSRVEVCRAVQCECDVLPCACVLRSAFRSSVLSPKIYGSAMRIKYQALGKGERV
jgi:hypothetical protein